MGTMTLTERDKRLLERLGSGPVDATDLADETADSSNAVADRLECMADNGLVTRDEEGGWTLTENGRRAIVAPGNGRSDERIDTPPRVETQLTDADLRPDREDAVRAAFGFLQYWTSATSAEIRDAAFDAWPAGYASRDEWWTECVRDQLAALPGVEPPSRPDGKWQYTSDSEGDEHPENGRWELTERGDGDFASAKHAIEHVANGNDERVALSAAFSLLEADGRAIREHLVKSVFDEYRAGFDSPDTWYGWIETVFEAIPGVERVGEGEWQYSSVDRDESD